MGKHCGGDETFCLTLLTEQDIRSGGGRKIDGKYLLLSKLV